MNNFNNLLSVVLLTIALSGCGTTPNSAPSDSNTLYPITENDNTTQNYDLDVVDYVVQRNDRLSDIAKKFTGQADNWPEIAEFNSITNPRSLQEGSVLAIPADLVIDSQRPSNVPVIQAEQTTSTPEAQTSTLAVRRNDADLAPVVVSPVNTNRDFELTPIDTSAATTTQNYSGAGAQIKVVGSYYPKGIYTEAAAHSKLIIRASPGTLFVLDRQINDWYKIETTAGSGYIRTSDAVIVTKNE